MASSTTDSTMELSTLHPGVTSRIQNTTDTYTVADGIVTLFAADAFEKGKDGIIDFVSTPEEFHFKYGKPNYQKYGQQAYNIDNWLAAGGQAFVMRVLPDNATYAHAVVNLQTKVMKNAKHIHLDATNEDVYLDDVELRPTAAFIEKNNLNLDVLKGELTKIRTTENTVDNFENHFLMMVYPLGRGESYNNLGFRIYPNGSYPNTNNAQVYNFEVVEYDDNGDMVMVEGPFYVTFSRNVMNGNSESMFIEDVVNRYSQYLRVEFNDQAFYDVAKIINPDVNPIRLEILTGQTMDDPTTGKPLTYYNEKTKRDEDVHLSLFKYNNEGVQLTHNGQPVINIPSTSDAVQQALVTLDNNVRESTYNTSVNKVSYMKKDFPKILETGFAPFKLEVNRIITPGTPSSGGSQQPTPSTSDTGEIPDFIKKNLDPSTDTLYKRYTTAKDAYTKTPNNDNLSSLLILVSQLIANVRSTYVDLLNQLDAAYTLVEKNSPRPELPAQYALDLNNLNNVLSVRDKINIFTVQHEKVLADTINEISDYQLGIYEGSDMEGISNILNSVETEIKYVYENLLPEAYNGYSQVPSDISKKFDKEQTDSIVAQYNRILKLFTDMSKGYIQDNPSNPTHKVDIYQTANSICSSLVQVIDTVSFQTSSDAVDKIVEYLKNNLYKDAIAFHDSIMTMITPQGTYDEAAIQDNARKQIDIQTNTIVATNSKFFVTNLLDFTTPIKLLLGSDGDFTYDANNLTARSQAIKNQIIAAYKGDINPDIANKQLYPFDLILDARYNNETKTAIANFVRETRQDCQFFADTAGTEFSVSPQDALNWRMNNFNIISQFISIFTQDLTYYDSYTGRNIRFTPTYMLASKVPTCAKQYGLQYPIAGPRRGVVDGQTAISWYPNDAYTERLYKQHINYIQYDNQVAKLGSQSTSLTGASALTQINNMFTILRMQRGVEALVSNYIFEFNDTETVTSMYNVITTYTQTFISDRSCEDVTVSISASDYDKQQRIIRVNVSVKFTGVIERVALTFNV